MNLPFVSKDALLEELSKFPKEAYIATDADGTLWSGDVGEDFYRAMVEQGDFREEALNELRGLNRELGLSTEGTGASLSRALFSAYEAGKFAESRCCAMIAALSAGWTTKELDAFCVALVEKENVRERLHDELVHVLTELARRGVKMVVVSASPVGIVRAGVAALNLPLDHVIAVTPELVGDRLGTRIVDPMPYGEGKAQALQKEIEGRTCMAAFGDNAFDVPMLLHSKIPVAVRPKPRLLARAGEVPNLRTLTR